MTTVIYASDFSNNGYQRKQLEQQPDGTWTESAFNDAASLNIMYGAWIGIDGAEYQYGAGATLLRRAAGSQTWTELVSGLDSVAPVHINHRSWNWTQAMVEDDRVTGFICKMYGVDTSMRQVRLHDNGNAPTVTVITTDLPAYRPMTQLAMTWAPETSHSAQFFLKRSYDRLYWSTNLRNWSIIPDVMAVDIHAPMTLLSSNRSIYVVVEDPNTRLRRVQILTHMPGYPPQLYPATWDNDPVDTGQPSNFLWRIASTRRLAEDGALYVNMFLFYSSLGSTGPTDVWVWPSMDRWGAQLHSLSPSYTWNVNQFVLESLNGGVFVAGTHKTTGAKIVAQSLREYHGSPNLVDPGPPATTPAPTTTTTTAAPGGGTNPDATSVTLTLGTAWTDTVNNTVQTKKGSIFLAPGTYRVVESNPAASLDGSVYYLNGDGTPGLGLVSFIEGGAPTFTVTAGPSQWVQVLIMRYSNGGPFTITIGPQ